MNAPSAGGTEAPIRVVVAEDQALVREGLVLLLGEAGFDVVAAAEDGPGLLEAVRHHEPDVAVVDVRMPPTQTKEGLEAALLLSHELPDVGILVLSQYVEANAAMQLFALGRPGLGYLLKQRVSSTKVMVDAIRRVARGGTVVDPEVVRTLTMHAQQDDRLQALTPRQLEVLELMAQGLANEAIADHLVVTQEAVEKQVSRIFSRLGLQASRSVHRRVTAVLVYLEGRAAIMAEDGDEGAGNRL
jgi:DNA-binding NarL/FixJ family response regulator